MTVAQVLVDGYDRIREIVAATVTGLSPEQLAFAPAPGANTIGWLIWHLTRIQDDHIAGAADTEQVWTSGGWFERFGLALDVSDTGYGHRPEQVSAVRVPSAQLLLDYHQAVFERSRQYLEGLTEVDLARVVDESWDPPVTLGVRLVSVLSDDLQHAGQAGYLTGLLSPTS
ncbi:MAG TPA: DinB family protein [Jatrophihabitans sp.]|uniref:mycothiol transferase n=1 Tax=Jatrophihabitans sp. TaxID=1932789 RepID=UPI002F058E3B